MTLKRLSWIIRLFCTRGGHKRAEYLRKKGIYAHIGNNVTIQSRMIPIYSELIYFHDNIHVARNVDFVTHDIVHKMLNNLPSDDIEEKFKEKIGCIEVMNNVFIGSNSVILYNTRIGPNVIIGSGSVVTKDCEPNSVYTGVPAKKVGAFDDFVRRRITQEKEDRIATTKHNQKLTKEEIEKAWDVFRKRYDTL